MSDHLRSADRGYSNVRALVIHPHHDHQEEDGLRLAVRACSSCAPTTQAEWQVGGAFNYSFDVAPDGYTFYP